MNPAARRLFACKMNINSLPELRKCYFGDHPCATLCKVPVMFSQMKAKGEADSESPMTWEPNVEQRIKMYLACEIQKEENKLGEPKLDA